MINMSGRIKYPMDERKPSLDENSRWLHEKISKYYRREESLRPLRISRSTVILVKPEKCNEEYAEKYRREKMRMI